MVSPFNELDPAEVERLALLAEECGEVIQAIGKILRHGYASVNPYAPPHNQPSNRQSLEREMGDVRAAMIMLCNAGDTDKAAIHKRADYKLISVRDYLHEQPTPEPVKYPWDGFGPQAPDDSVPITGTKS